MTWITTLLPTRDTPQALHEKRLARKLRLRARGRSDGADNYPASQSTELTETELTILTVAQQHVEMFRQWLSREFKAIVKTIAALAPTQAERDFGSLADAVRFALVKLRDERREEIASTAQELRKRELQLRHFQVEHRLTHRSATHFPTIYWLGSATLMLVAETSANASFFAVGSEYGWVQGASTALLFSLGNFLLGFGVIGVLGLRYAGHLHLGKRLAGIATTVIGGLLALVYNAWVSQYRALLGNPDGTSFGSASHALLADPTGFLNSDQGPLLFLIGLGAVLLFAIEGYLLFADRYPGYGAIDRAFRDAVADHEEEKRDFRDAAIALVEDKIAGVDTSLATLEGKSRTAIDTFNHAEVQAQAAQQAALESLHVAQRMVAAYRAENTAVRDTPAPAYFRRLPDFDAGLNGVSTPDFAALRRAQHDDIAALRVQARAAKEALRGMVLETLETLKAHIAAAESEGLRRARMDGAAPKTAAPTLRSFPQAAE